MLIIKSHSITSTYDSLVIKRSKSLNYILKRIDIDMLAIYISYFFENTSVISFHSTYYSIYLLHFITFYIFLFFTFDISKHNII